jgi:hypothetical protein
MNHSEAGKLGHKISKNKLVKFCSEQKLKAKDKWNYKKCKFCESIIPYKSRRNKFCNHSCAAKYYNKSRIKYDKVPKRCSCKVCDKELIKKGQHLFCSIECFQKQRWIHTKEKIEKEQKAPHVGTAKKYISETSGNKCSICGVSTWMNKEMPLVLDHIDGNSYNHSISNLRLVCSNCDAQLPTYKGKNYGNGRHLRKIRYRNKMSY